MSSYLNDIENTNNNEFLTKKEINGIFYMLSDELVFKSLKDQILNVFNMDVKFLDSITVDYYKFFKSKFDFIEKNYSKNDIVMQRLNKIKSDFYYKILGYLKEVYNFDIEFSQSLLNDEIYNIIEMMYYFLIINFKKNITFYTFKYIMKEKKNLIKTYKPLTNKKGLAFSFFKKQFSMDDSIIITNLNDIINSIEIVSLQDFIKIVTDEDPDELNNFYMRELFLLPDTYAGIGIDNKAIVNKMKNYIKDNSSLKINVKSKILDLLEKQQKLKENGGN